MATGPDVSVIIPAFGRVAALEGCLAALASQTISRDRFEVVVCDDGSALPLAAALQTTLRKLNGRLHVRVVRQRNAGPAAARNRAAAVARGRFLAFTDDDCRPAPDWLASLLRHFEAHPGALVGGGMCASADADPFARATQTIMTFAYAEQARRGGMLLFSTSNLALPAKQFRELGGFSRLFRRAGGEDYDLCARWHRSGGQVAYVPEALVVHDHALTLATYCAQHFRYGRGLLTMRQRLGRHGAVVRPGSVPGSFHVRLIAHPISTRGFFGIGTAMLIAVSQFATVAGVLAQIVRRESVDGPETVELEIPGRYARASSE